MIFSRWMRGEGGVADGRGLARLQKQLCLPKVHTDRLLATWQTKVFELLVAAGTIDQQTVDQMRSWPHSGFSVDNSVYLSPGDTAGLERLAEYILRCPFSLARHGFACVFDV